MTHPDATGKIHQFTPLNGRAKPEDQESVLELLGRVKEQVEKGLVAGLGVAVARPNGSCNCSHSASSQAPALLGAATLLVHRLTVNIEDEPPHTDQTEL